MSREFHEDMIVSATTGKGMALEVIRKTLAYNLYKRIRASL